MEIKKCSVGKKIALTVSVEGDDFTETEQREILQEFADLSHSLYLALAAKLTDDKTLGW